MSVPVGIKLASGGKLLVCEVCSEPFVWYERFTPAKTCPKCTDIKQARPTIATRRECAWQMDGIRVVNLPGTWESFQASEEDRTCYRISIKGKEFGASWNGRIELFANQVIEPSTIVRIREMVTSHRTKVVEEARVRSDFNAGEPVHFTVQREVGLNSSEGEEVVLERRYLAIEVSKLEQPVADLVWDTARTKTTLKGFGRQYWASVFGTPIRQWTVNGGARSGRFDTTGVLAVVDTQHPLIIKGTGDIQFERVYPQMTDIQLEPVEAS